MSRRSVDFPVPALPVMKRLLPFRVRQQVIARSDSVSLNHRGFGVLFGAGIRIQSREIWREDDHHASSCARHSDLAFNIDVELGSSKSLPSREVLEGAISLFHFWIAPAFVSWFHHAVEAACCTALSAGLHLAYIGSLSSHWP